MNRPLEIVIVGGGTAGWMCAAACVARLDGQRVRVRLVESDEIGTVGVGEATLPQMRDFNDLVGIDEAEFMRATQATFKLGIEFVGWGREEERYVHPFGTFGRPIGDADFFQYWVRARNSGAAGPLSDYCLPIVAAGAARFAPPPRGGAPSLKSAYAYAYHLDASLYARFLRRWAEQRGLKRIEGRVIEVERRADGGVAAVLLASGERVAGDLFVDCSGFRSLLIGKTLGVPFESWSRWLPCDRAVALPCEPTEPLLPFTRVTAQAAGWTWRIPLQHRTGNGYVFSSAFIDADAATRTLYEAIDGAPRGEPRVLPFEAGKRARSWKSNCVALGLSGGFLEPLESTSIYLIQMGIAFLLTLLPDGPEVDPALSREFNRQMEVEYDRIRDFLILHYHANQRGEGEFWRYCRETPPPDTLAARIEQFVHRGHTPNYRDGLFGPPSWQAVMVGQNIAPRGHDRLADRLPEPLLRERLAALAAEIEAEVAPMPSHAAFVRNHCAADEASLLAAVGRA